METFMQEQIEAKLNEGYSCIKMKIGAIDFDTELKILKSNSETTTTPKPLACE